MGHGPWRDEVRGKSRRWGHAEGKHADEREREEKRFHRSMFSRPRSCFNRSTSFA
jgi:hypothetical protein